MTITYDCTDSIALVRMDDGKANALSYGLMDELDAALTRAEAEAKAVVLVGREGRFSGGFDLREMMAGSARARALVTRGAELLLRLYLYPLPLVTACSGHALAGGALMMVTGDVRVGVRGPFQIGLNEVQIGLPVPILAMELARDRLAPSHLLRATLHSAISTPDEALAVGWVDELADPADLLATALAHGRRLSAFAPRAYAATKACLRERTARLIRDTLPADLERLVP